MPIRYTHQREQKGMAHTLLTAKDHVDDDIMLMLGDNIFNANPENTVRRQRENQADATFLVEDVSREEMSRYGVCVTNDYGEIVEMVENQTISPWVS